VAKYGTTKKLKTIIVRKQKESIPTKINNKLCWYDSFYKKMLNFEGSHLVFDYKIEKYIEFPDGSKKPENETTKKEKDKYSIKEVYLSRPRVVDFLPKKDKIKDVKKWFETFLNYNNTSATILDDRKNETVFEIEEKDEDDFLYALERSGFRYS